MLALLSADQSASNRPFDLRMTQKVANKATRFGMAALQALRRRRRRGRHRLGAKFLSEEFDFRRLSWSLQWKLPMEKREVFSSAIQPARDARLLVSLLSSPLLA